MKKTFCFIFTVTLIGSLVASFGIINAQTNLKDIKGHWAMNNIQMLADEKIINGYVDGTFKPDSTISKAEFTKILISSLGYKDLENSKKDHWSKNYVDKAIELGILEKSEISNLDSNIIRGQIAKMVTKAISATKEDLPSKEEFEKYKNQITDIDKIPSEYKDFIINAYGKGIIQGYEKSDFKYDKTATRAESTTMTIRLKNKDKRVVPKIKTNEEITKQKDDLKEIPGVNKITKFKESTTASMISSGENNFRLWTEDGKKRDGKIDGIHIISKTDLPIQISDNFIIEEVTLNYEKTNLTNGNSKDYILYVKVKALKDNVNPTDYLYSGAINNNKKLEYAQFSNFDDESYFKYKKQYPTLMGRMDSPDGTGYLMKSGEEGVIVNISQATGDANFSGSEYIIFQDSRDKNNKVLAIKNPLKK